MKKKNKRIHTKKQFFQHNILLLTIALVFILVFVSTSKNISRVVHPAATEIQYKDSSPLVNGEKNPPLTPPPQIILHGPRDQKRIALTFDAEMTDSMRENFLSGRVSSFDPQIIATLIQTQTKATLFLTGMWIELYPGETKSFARNPLFELASHSYADTSYDGYCYGLPKIADDQDLEDIETTQRLLRTVAGVQNHLFRFPGGCYSDKDLDIVTNTAGLTIVHWDVTGDDGFNQNTQSIVQSVVNNTQNGSIIILHLNGSPTAPKTAEALPTIISELKKRGFAFVKVSELL